MTQFDPSRLYLFEGKLIDRVHPFQCWDHPGAVPPAQAGYADDTEVLVAEEAGEARAWPVHVIASHHLVADRLGGRELLVTF